MQLERRNNLQWGRKEEVVKYGRNEVKRKEKKINEKDIQS
jgi:hypothetical protein